MSYADVDASGNKRENLKAEDKGDYCYKYEMVETNNKGCVLKDYTIQTFNIYRNSRSIRLILISSLLAAV